MGNVLCSQSWVGGESLDTREISRIEDIRVGAVEIV